MTDELVLSMLKEETINKTKEKFSNTGYQKLANNSFIITLGPEKRKKLGLKEVVPGYWVTQISSFSKKTFDVIVCIGSDDIIGMSKVVREDAGLSRYVNKKVKLTFDGEGISVDDQN